MAALYARFTAFEAAFNAQDAIDFTQNHAEIPVRGAFGILSPSPLRVPFESFGPIVGQTHDDGYPRPTASASSPSCPVGTTLPPAAIGDSPRPPPTSRPCFNTLCTASFSPAHVATSIIIFFITHLLLTHLLPQPRTHPGDLPRALPPRHLRPPRHPRRQRPQGMERQTDVHHVEPVSLRRLDVLLLLTETGGWVCFLASVP